MADASIWQAIIPAATLGIGYAAKTAQDWLQDSRKLKAEREARHEATRDRKIERRDDLQRATLLEIQDRAQVMFRHALKIAHFLEMTQREEGDTAFKKKRLPPEDDEGLRQAISDLTLLTSRIRDKQLRDMSMQVRHYAGSMGIQKTASALLEFRNEAAAPYRAFLERAGELIRQLDDV